MPDLSDSVNWSEVDANNNQAPPNGWPEGMMPSGVNDAARADKGALKRFWNKLNPVQVVVPSGGVYTFVTGNPAYPTAYVQGEIYSFFPGVQSGGGEQFQVNALGAKPIQKKIAPGVWVAIGPYDLNQNHPSQLVYDTTLNGGLGAFVLLNPFIPLQGDGTGTGMVISGNLIINQDGGAVRPTHPLAIQTIGAPGAQPGWFNDTYGGSGSLIALRRADGSNAGPTPLVSGDLIGAYSFRGWDSVGAADFTPSSARVFATATEAWNTGAHGTQVEIDTCNNGSTIPSSQMVIGPGLTVGAPTAPSGGMLIGDLNAQRVFCQGQLLADGTGSSNVPGNATVGGTLTVTGVSQFNNNLGITGHLGVSGNADITGNISSGAGVGGQSLYSAHDATIGGNVFPATDNVSHCGFGGNAWASVNAYNYFTATSSSISKSDITVVRNDRCLSLVECLDPVTFKYRNGRDDRTHWGFTVEDVKKTVGQLGLRFDAFYDNPDGTSGMAYIELIAVLWGALKELSKRLDDITR